MSHLHVVGTGLIGASFAMAAREAACFTRITGADADPTRVGRAVELGVIDAQSDGVGADAVLVAVPVGQIAGVVVALESTGVAQSSTLFDVGSTKREPLAALAEALGSVPGNFVPCHPMAGSDQSGPEAASAELFRGKRVFITPHQETEVAHLERVRDWWQACGAQVSETSAEYHDAAVALTSHLPHLLAAAFMALIEERDDAAIMEFAGSGFADFTRIAGGDPALWRDIVSSNREAITAQLNAFAARLADLQANLRDGRLETLEALLARAQHARRSFSEGGEPEGGDTEGKNSEGKE
jgi:prephenate dehydrogenase